MKVLNFFFPVMILIGLFGSSSAYAQFDDVYFDPEKDKLPVTYAQVDNNKTTTKTTTTASGGYEGNSTIGRSDDGYDDESYDNQDAYDMGYEDGYYTSLSLIHI